MVGDNSVGNEGIIVAHGDKGSGLKINFLNSMKNFFRRTNEM
jgi:hypothetical protein